MLKDLYPNSCLDGWRGSFTSIFCLGTSLILSFAGSNSAKCLGAVGLLSACCMHRDFPSLSLRLTAWDLFLLLSSLSLWPYAPSLKCSEGCKPWVIIARKSSLPYSSFNFGLAQFCALYLQPPIVYCCGVFPAEIAVKELLPYCICGMLLTSYYMSYSHKVVVKSCRPVVKRPNSVL